MAPFLLHSQNNRHTLTLMAGKKVAEAVPSALLLKSGKAKVADENGCDWKHTQKTAYNINFNPIFDRHFHAFNIGRCIYKCENWQYSSRTVSDGRATLMKTA